MNKGTYDLYIKGLCVGLVSISGFTAWLMVELYAEIKKDIEQIATDTREYRAESTSTKERLASLEARIR